MDDKNVNKRFVALPSGQRDDSDNSDEETSNIPIEFRGRSNVEFTFGDRAYCAFGNMANALALLKHEEAALFFFRNRFKPLVDLLKEYTTLNIESGSPNEFMSALRIAREKFGYTTRFLGQNHEPWLSVDEDKDVVKYIELQGVNNVVTHTICVFNNYIYDGSEKKTINLSKRSLKWLIKEEQFYIKCYSLEQSEGVKNMIRRRNRL